MCTDTLINSVTSIALTYIKKVKRLKVALWGFFNTAAVRPIVFLPPSKFPHSSPEAPRIIQMRETSTSEGGNYNQILLANSNLRKSARIFYMPQSWDMGHYFTSPPKEGILRIFRTPEKSNGFGRV